jgi:hypothetical protein
MKIRVASGTSARIRASITSIASSISSVDSPSRNRTSVATSTSSGPVWSVNSSTVRATSGTRVEDGRDPASRLWVGAIADQQASTAPATEA